MLRLKRIQVRSHNIFRINIALKFCGLSAFAKVKYEEITLEGCSNEHPFAPLMVQSLRMYHFYCPNELESAKIDTN